MLEIYFNTLGAEASFGVGVKSSNQQKSAILLYIY